MAKVFRLGLALWRRQSRSVVVNSSICGEDAPIFQARRLAAPTPLTTPHVGIMNGRDNLMTGSMGKAKDLNAFSVSVKICSQSSAYTSMVSGQRQPAVGEQQVSIIHIICTYTYKLDVFKARVPYETHSRVLIDVWCDCKLFIVSEKSWQLQEVNWS